MINSVKMLLPKKKERSAAKVGNRMERKREPSWTEEANLSGLKRR